MLLLMDKTRLAAADLGTVLGVWAHPDDEAYLSSGLMAAARDAGHRVVVATATYGERGSTSTTLRTKHGVEHGGVLGVAIPDQKPEPSGALPQLEHQVTSLLGHLLPGRVVVAPSRCTRRVATSIRNSR